MRLWKRKVEAICSLAATDLSDTGQLVPGQRRSPKIEDTPTAWRSPRLLAALQYPLP